MAKKVLVVDDEKLIVKGIRFSLEQDGMQVDCAYDGQEAIDLATNNKYDIILLDVMLPIHDGFEVCQQIREFYLLLCSRQKAMTWIKFSAWNTVRMIILQNRLTYLK